MQKRTTKEKSRRSNGEGSFTQRKDGRQQASIRIDRKRYVVYGKTRQEAYGKLQAKIAEIKSGKPPASKITVKEYLLKYLGIREVDYKASSLQGATRVLVKEIIPALGDILLSELTLDDIQNLIVAWRKRGLKGQTIEDYFSYFRTALSRAVKTKLIAANPCAGATLPRVEKREQAILSRAQITALLGLFGGHWFLPIFVLFLATGLRKGELLALKWEDVDLEARVLHVRRAVSWVTGVGYVEDTPKTESSARDIFLPPFAIQMLRQHRTDQDEQRYLVGSHWVEHGLVFTRARGDHIRGGALNYALATRLKKADIPHVAIHGLRHTTASQLLSMRVNPKVVQELLGHANIQTTLDIYDHCLPKEQEEAMLELNDAFWAGQEAMVVKMAVRDEAADFQQPSTCICGQTFVPPSGPGRTRQYCSDRCASRARKRTQRKRQEKR